MRQQMIKKRIENVVRHIILLNAVLIKSSSCLKSVTEVIICCKMNNQNATHTISKLHGWRDQLKHQLAREEFDTSHGRSENRAQIRVWTDLGMGEIGLKTVDERPWQDAQDNRTFQFPSVNRRLCTGFG
jgi:hypothetical protein